MTESGSSAKNDIDTMELVAMGMGGFLTLINATPYEWDLIYHHSFCMNGWDSAFPTSIGPGGAERIYVEFDTWEVFDDTQDAAEAIYSFGPSSSPFSFQVQARGNSGANVFDPHLQIQFDNFQTPGNPRGSILNLGWNHGYPHAVATSGAFGQPLNLWGNGSVTFILSMDAAGNLHSSNPPGATWMSDNLGTLGGRTLRQLCMPGTHDSGMSQIGSCTEFGDAFNTRTQSQGIYGQLVEGARYFDIRPVISDGVFVTGHYSFLGSILKSQGCNGQSIAGVIDDINRFTGQVLGGRQERGLIILSLSADMNTDLGEGNYRSLTQEEWNRLLGELQQINHLYVHSDPHSIASMAWASGTVTVTTSGPHGFDVATPNVIIAGVAPDDYNGAFPCTITSSTTFTYALASNPGTVATEGTYQPVVDLSQLTLNDYVLSVPFGGAAVVVIVDPSDPSLPNKVLGTTYFGQGFYYPSNLPLSGTYADKDDVGSMAQDQIGKLQAQRTSQDDKMFQFAWFLTQQQSDVVGDVSRSILSLANWANPWVGINLWPNLRMNCFPNILMTDDIDSIYYWTDGENDHATNVNSCPTTALAIAINDFTAPDPAPVKKLNTFHDASGKVTVSVFSRQSSWPRQIFTDFGVTVDRDMVCVGGGAIGDDNPGGLLTASYPNEDLSGWLVSSKDHINVDRYRLTAFAIGLKIDGMTRPQLMDSINVQFADSATGEHPEAAVSVLNEYVLISGGFRVNYQAVGNLGTASFPDGAITWKARSKDHIDASSAIIRVYAIGLSQHLPVGSVTVQIEQQESARAEHPQATANLGQGFAITGGGAEVVYSGAGSLLWKLEPTQTDSQDFTAASKDHIETDPATITSYVLGIKIVGVAPTAPTITGLTNGDGKVSVAFSDTNPGTSPITSYTVTATDDSNANGTRTATGPSSPIEVSGLINGGTYEFTVTATNAFGTSAPSASSGRLNVGVAPTLPSDPADGTVGKSYSSGFDATGAPPPTVTQVSGALPPGLFLHGDGTLTGNPTQAGSYQFTVQAANDVGTTDNTVTVTISP